MIGSFRFAPFHGHILLTNDAGRFAFLTPDAFDALLKERLPHDGETWQMLRANFFCDDGVPETYLRRAENAVRANHAYLFSPTSLFIFALTNRCNNRCVYCQANGGAQAADMDMNTAHMALDRIAESPVKALTIEFQGGEPLMNWPVIREIVHYAEQVLSGRSVAYSLVSNLALMDAATADFIIEHGISVSTSLDGPRQLHDANRPSRDSRGSYDAMLRGKALLEERGATIGAIETTTRASLSHGSEIIQTYVELGFQSVFLRPLTRLGAAEKHWAELGYSAEEFLDFYRKGIQVILSMNRAGIAFYENHAAIFLTKMLGGSAPNYMELRSPCGAVLGQLAFTASGDVFTCDEGRMLAEMGDPAFKIGNVWSSGYDDWLSSSVCRAVCSSSLLETLPGCCDCVYQPYCGVCPVVSYALDGSLTPIKPNGDRCRIYRGMLETLFEIMLEEEPQTIALLRGWAKGN